MNRSENGDGLHGRRRRVREWGEEMVWSEKEGEATGRIVALELGDWFAPPSAAAAAALLRFVIGNIKG